MRIGWPAVGVISLCVWGNLALAAAYPEPVWLDTEIPETISYDYGLRFEFNSGLFRASALKNQSCILGSQLGCVLQ